MLKIHNLTPDHFHHKYYLSNEKATMISDYCWRLGVAFAFDDSSNLCEVELTKEDFVVDSLLEIDWAYLQKNVNKKLIITHRTIISLEIVYKTLNDLVEKYNCADRVWWYSINPLDFKLKSNLKFNLAFLDSFTNVFCEAYILAQYHSRRNKLTWSLFEDESVYYVKQRDFSKSANYYLSSSHTTKSHRLLSTYLIKDRIGFEKGRVSFLGLGKWHPAQEFNDHTKYLIEQKDKLLSYNIDVEELLEFQKFRAYLDDPEATPAACMKSSYLDILESCLVNFVNEATSNNLEIFITEKTWQNYAIGRPFILNGNKGALQYLNRYYGFKSFDPIIDETYDLKDNFIDRTYYAVDALFKFCSLPFSEAKSKIESLSEVFDHNFNVFNSIDHKGKFLRMFDGI